MGYGTWNAGTWGNYCSSRITGKSVSQIYNAKQCDPKYDPKNVTVRESRDSADHAVSTPIIIGLDVTGSMGNILNVTAQKLGELVKDIIERKPVTGPQIMFNAIGDGICDRMPLQVTQFESDIRIATQLTELWFEQGGGGNGFESYPLAWYFAANKIQTDAWEKRQQKGFLFTMGDDGFPDVLTKREIEQIFGDTVSEDIDTKALYAQICRKYEVFHLMLMQGSNARSIGANKWRALMGERAISVYDYNCLPQIIVSLMESVAGRPHEEIIASWDGNTQLAVRKALEYLQPKSTGTAGKIMKF